MFERIKTALVLLVVVGLCLFATRNEWPITALLTVALLVGASEWAKFIPAPFPAVATIGVIGLFGLGVYLVPPLWPTVWLVSSAFWLVALYWLARFPQHTGWHQPALVVVGALLLTATVTACLSLWKVSAWWLLYVFGLVWAADSGAYFAGRAFGKHKLAPSISPGKTREGLAGGLSLAILLMVLVGVFLRHLQGGQLAVFIGLSIVVVLLSVMGDLFESMLKRQAGIKDSGNVLPGHGGVLDRIDSLLSAVPLFAAGFAWLGPF